MSSDAAQIGRRRAREGGLSLLSLLAAAPVEPLRAGAVITLITAIIAVQSVEAGLVPRVPDAPEEAASDTPDPVLVRVGDAAVRVSDLRAQAGAAASAVSPDTLVRQGYLDDATQQLVLAQAAEADGLADALEVRAALALARRRVLSEAYLDLAVSRAVTPEAVKEAYDAEVRAARAHDRVSLRHVLTTTEEGANEALRRAQRGERFATLAARLSQDEATKDQGGSFGMVHPDALPGGLREAAATAPLGTLMGPIRTEAGYHVVRVDARRQVAVPAFTAREGAIREALRAQAMREAATRAEASLHIQTAPAGEGLTEPAPAPSATPGPSGAPAPTGGAGREGGSNGGVRVRSLP